MCASPSRLGDTLKPTTKETLFQSVRQQRGNVPLASMRGLDSHLCLHKSAHELPSTSSEITQVGLDWEHPMCTRADQLVSSCSHKPWPFIASHGASNRHRPWMPHISEHRPTHDFPPTQTLDLPWVTGCTEIFLAVMCMLDREL